ncbi:MAG TPA: DUF4199 domain-containing protein [Flavobacterium sp.]|nr:DUF4199 domain-containing protein [Flavobacterium sp.]
MENKTVTSKKPGLDYGIYYGLAVILSFVIIYALDIDPIENPLIGTISSVCSYLFFPVTFIALALQAFKKNNHGFMSFGEAIKTGVTVTFLGALIFGVFNLIFNLVFPEYMDEILNQTRRLMMKQNPSMTTAQLDSAIQMTKKFTSPEFSIPISIVIFSFLGLIYSLIIGAITKKDKPVFN